MLQRINSFYHNTIVPTANVGWKKIPADKVSDFFQKTVPDYMKKVWNSRPSLTAMKNVTWNPSWILKKVSSSFSEKVPRFNRPSSIHLPSFKKPTDFFQNTVPVYMKKVWDSRPSLTVIRNVAALTGGIVVAYKIYRSFQSLKAQIKRLEAEKGQLEQDLSNPTIEKIIENFEKKLKETTDAQLLPSKGKLEIFSKKLNEQLEDLEMISFESNSDEENESSEELQNDKLDSSKSQSADNLEENEAPLIGSNRKDSSEEVSDEHSENPPDNALVSFKMNLPGADIQFNVGGEQCILADVLLKTLFRIDEQPEVNLENSVYTLRYQSPKIIRIKQLPKSVWDKMSRTVATIISGLLKISPNGCISQEMTVRFENTNGGTSIIFDENAFTLQPNKLGYTAHIKSVTIPNNPNGYIEIETEHNSWAFRSKKVACVSPQLLVEILQLNLQ